MLGAATASTASNWLDPVLYGLIVLSVLFGIRRGLLRSIAGVLGLVLAALFAGRVAALVEPTLDHAGIKHPSAPAAVVFVIAFIAIVVAVEFAAGILRFVQRVLFLGWIDRLGGALFGLIRGILFCMILVAGLSLYGSTSEQATTRQSSLAVWLWQNMSGLAGMLPSGMQQSTIRLVHDKAPFVAQKALGQP